MGTSRSFAEAATKTERFANELLGPAAQRALRKGGQAARRAIDAQADRVLPLSGFGRGTWRGKIDTAPLRLTPVAGGVTFTSYISRRASSTMSTQRPGILVKPTRASSGLWAFLEHGTPKIRFRYPRRQGRRRRSGTYVRRGGVEARGTWSAGRRAATPRALAAIRRELLQAPRKVY